MSPAKVCEDFSGRLPFPALKRIEAALDASDSLGPVEGVLMAAVF